MKLNDRVIAVIGLGYVGLPLAIEYGKKYRVIGFDIYQARVDELNRGEDHTLEADLVGMKQARDAYESTKKIGLTFTSNMEDLKQVNTCMPHHSLQGTPRSTQSETVHKGHSMHC